MKYIPITVNLLRLYPGAVQLTMECLSLEHRPETAIERPDKPPTDWRTTTTVPFTTIYSNILYTVFSARIQQLWVKIQKRFALETIKNNWSQHSVSSIKKYISLCNFRNYLVNFYLYKALFQQLFNHKKVTFTNKNKKFLVKNITYIPL